MKCSDNVNFNKYFIEYIKLNPLTFFVYFLLLLVYPIQKILLPKYYGIVISSLKDSKQGSKSKFMTNVYYLVGIFALVQLLYTINYKVQGSLIPNFSEYTISEIFSLFINNKDVDHENLKLGEILAKLIKVPNVIYDFMNLFRTLLFSQTLVVVLTIYYYATVSLNTALVFTGLSLIMYLLQFISYKITLGVELKREKENDKIYGHLQDILNNLINIIISKQESHERNVLKERFQPYIKVFTESLNVNFNMRNIFSVFNIVSFVLINYVLYKEYTNKKIDQEQFISSFIVTYSILQGLFSESYYSVRSITDMYSQIEDTELFFNKMLNKNKNKVKKDENEKFKNGNIVFKDVNVIYRNNGKTHYALNNINLTIKEKENVAIVGQIGSGKSTLVKVLLKLLEPNSGDVTIGDINIENISRDEILDNVFYVPQKPKLLNRTLYENIVYGMETENINKKDNVKSINSIMKKIGLHKNIIQIFNEKMDKSVGVEGILLSGGQRQIVWIIRAMMRNPSILIFDEPTSALDPKNKDIIIKAIKNIGKDKTVLIITHDSIDYDFRKITLANGKLVNETNCRGIKSYFNFKSLLT